MIQIYEITDKQMEVSAKAFNINASSLDRVFIMEEAGSQIGIGVLSLDGGVVVLRDIITHKPFNYFDLLARSLLGIVRDMPRLKVRIQKPDSYFYRFGFKDNNGFLEILSDDINLAGSCGGHN